MSDVKAIRERLPDGEYAGLGTLRMSLRDAREALATAAQPTDKEGK